MNIAGYLIHRSPGVFSGQPGNHYDYIMAGNGLFIRAENQHLQAVVQIARARVRGLAPLAPEIQLKHGKIPGGLFASSIRMMQLSLGRELYLAVVWENGAYALRVPQQEASGAHVTYHNVPNKVLDLHSHPTMAGRFSGIDDRDEVGFQVYGVIGRLDHLIPEYSFRIGVYGHFQALPLEVVFDYDRR